MTHTEASAKFKKCRNKDVGYRLASHTRLQKRGNSFAVKFHDTDIVIIREDGTYRINSGGWKTVTTKARISSIIPRRVSQSMGIWYIDKIPFYDGMLVGNDGCPVGPHKLKDIEKIKQKVDRTFTKFLNILFDTLAYSHLSGWRQNVHAPNVNSKTYAKKLWHMASTIVENNKAHRKSKCVPHSDIWHGIEPAERDKIILLSVARSSTNHPQVLWEYIAVDILNNRHTKRRRDIIRFFFSKRKVIIAEMIASREIN